ncbi:MAG TPA: class I SAM-dependent methyltransferase, partial [Acidimicrobiales bacterium]|nr:class I SAM-dependent methyltransferase [Acidimicrobiales bacterium]
SQVLEFLGGDRISMAGRRVADIGCGDGIIDLGVVHQAEPELLVGFDVMPTDTTWLLERARAEGVAEELPATLEFRTCEPDHLPADDDSFDVVFTWSAFEHVAEPGVVAKEIRRILRPDGILMLQLWPFYHSEHGAHLWQSLPESSYVQLRHPVAEVVRQVRAAAAHEPAVLEEFVEVFATLNRVTLDDLQRALMSAGLVVTKLELMTETVRIPMELARRPLTHLAVSGVKLLAVPA